MKTWRDIELPREITLGDEKQLKSTGEVKAQGIEKKAKPKKYKKCLDCDTLILLGRRCRPCQDDHRNEFWKKR